MIPAPTHARYAGALVALAAVAVAATAPADPPAPKVCVAVAGDPDPAAQSAAARLAELVAATPTARAVSNEDARAVLRGEARSDVMYGRLASDRRALAGADADAPTLDSIGQSLGCAVVIEVAARPASLEFRGYNVVHHVWVPPVASGAVDATLFERVVLAAMRATPAPPPSEVAPLATDASVTASAAPDATAASGPTVPPPPPAADAGADADPRVALNPGGNDASRGPGYIPWVIAGSLAATLLVGFIIAQTTGPETPVITVIHRTSPQ